jgi:hypothetical protein
MPPVKTKVLTPEPISTGPAVPGPEIPTSQPKTETDATAPEPVTHDFGGSSTEVPAPNRPGLETPATPQTAATADPFVLLNSWGAKNTHWTLRAMPVPGGCIFRLSGGIQDQAVLSGSICFVPGVQIVDGKLVAA